MQIYSLAIWALPQPCIMLVSNYGIVLMFTDQQNAKPMNACKCEQDPVAYHIACIAV